MSCVLFGSCCVVESPRKSSPRIRFPKSDLLLLHISYSCCFTLFACQLRIWLFDSCLGFFLLGSALGRSTMSYFLPHLPTGWHVDQAILSEEDRVVIIRFGHDTDPVCMEMDETLYKISTAVQKFAVIYLVDITQVPDFNKMYELYDACSTMFFYRNKHIMIDLGTGNNNKM